MARDHLTPSQTKCLAYLAAHPGFHNAKLLRHKQGHHLGTLDALERRGLIRFDSGMSALAAEITPAGRKALEDHGNAPA